MAAPGLIKKTLTISADAETWAKFERFLALMHYNAGHSAIFGMAFDGDGADTLKVDPAPDEALRKPAQRIGDAGPELEIAGVNSYTARKLDRTAVYYTLSGKYLERGVWSNVDGEIKETVREYKD